MTVIGLLVLLFLIIFMRKEIDIKIIAGRIAVIFKNRVFGGLELGIVYLEANGNSFHTHCHELGHTLQCAFYGPFFPFLVAIPSAIRYWYRRKNKNKKNLPPYDSI